MPEIIFATKTKALEEKLGERAFDELSDLFITATSRQKQEIRTEQFHEREKIELRLEKRLSELEVKLIKEISSTKSELKADISALRSELKSDNEALRSELKSGNGALRSELKSDNDLLRIEIVKNKAEMIKWMFIFCIGSVLTLLGSLFGYIKLILGK